ncbi:hypothetical protein [Geobacter sulfurreducens]|uniref:hypothetical protein n=1 Tax=Geobacter sulfurreducens TaxID=35554 RepID=UPI000DBB51F4|nr:hypothetical protein [Geobacter sulfurreducens]BBA71741.1 hypothetical protein YM18_3233 [Geobacter sulfurreducens]
MDRHTQARKVSRIIYQHGTKMSPRLMDSALDLWERLMKSGNITVDTSAADRRREEREREEAKLSTKGKETGRSFKIGYGNSRSLNYQIGNDGELIVTPDKQSTYTPKDYKAMLEAITRDIERRERSMEKSKKTGTRWSRIPMLLKKPTTTTTKRWEQPQPKAKHQETKMQVQPIPQQATATRQPWGQSRSLWGNQPAETSAPVQQTQPTPQSSLTRQPWGTLPRTFAGRIPTTGLSGHQLAGMRAAGLDPMTPGLETMTLDQMKALAADQAASSVAGLAEKANLAYVRDPRPRKW